MPITIRSIPILAVLCSLGTVGPALGSYLPPIRPVQPIHVNQWTLGVTWQDRGVGTQITGVANGSPAQQVGLERGDVILAVSGTPVGLLKGQRLDLDVVLNATANARGQVTLSVQDSRTGQVGFVPVQLAAANLGIQPIRPPGLQIQPDQQIRGWYLMYLGRVPRQDEIQAWLVQLTRGASLADVQVSVLASPEYYQRYKNNPALFVQSIYEPILNRQLTRIEIGILVQRLATNFRGNRTRFIQNALAGN